MAVFMRKLEEAQEQNHCKRVSLVGHSMGAMVLDRGLREFPGIRYKDIVYMAAACSIQDFYDTAIPYLERPENRKTEFYGICLNPRAEDRDISFGELVPRASLLVWIDNFLGHPQSFTDRRLGMFENAMLASRMFPPRLQNRLHFTALATGPGVKQYDRYGHLTPEFDEHGQFGDTAFWNPRLYKEPGYVNRRGDPTINLALPIYNDEKAENARRHLPGNHGPDAKFKRSPQQLSSNSKLDH